MAAEQQSDTAPSATYDASRAARSWTRHAVVLALAAALVFAFWRSRMEWTPDMRLWRAVGDASFVLLALALAVGPLAVVWPRARPLVAWRRALGVGSALVASLHSYLVWDGWALWSLRRFFGYQNLSQAGGPDNIMVDPGFGLSNLMGTVALAWMLIIAATSSDRALRRLGARAWKYVQGFAYVVFYLVGLHVAYFLFLHYEPSVVSLVFQKATPEPNWARPWFVLAVLAVLGLQLAAFAKQVRRREAPSGRQRSRRRDAGPESGPQREAGRPAEAVGQPGVRPAGGGRPAAGAPPGPEAAAAAETGHPQP